MTDRRPPLFYLAWILRGLAEIRGLYALALLSGIAHMGLALLAPLLIREAVLALEGKPSLGIPLSAALLGVLAIGEAVARYEVVYLPHRVAYEYLQRMRVIVFAHLQRLHHGYFGRERTGDLMSKALSDVEALEHFVAHGFPTTVKHLVVAAAMAFVLVGIDGEMALATLGPLPVVIVAMLWASGVARGRYRRLRRLFGELSALLQDSIVGLAVLKSFDHEREQLGKLKAKTARVQETIGSLLAVRDLPVTATETLSGIATVLVLAVGIPRVRAGSLGLADLFVFVLYSLLFYRPFLELTTVFDRLQDSIVGAERVHGLLATVPDIEDDPHAAPPERPAWSIAFESVRFGYEPGTDVLGGVDLHVAEGEVTALVGPSGSGKTTIAALVARFYDPAEGRVLIGGRDARALPLGWLRDNVAMVLQDVFLFNDTIRENIRFGRPDATDAEIEAAARAANIHDLIVSLPDGYDTAVGERGARLSGGEKQRIAIARALLKDAPILVLDEATSSVDVEGEGLIQAAIARLTRGRTVVVIAHRLSTIRGAHRILVLGEGRIVEHGRHEALMSLGGRYAAMFKMQERAASWQIAAAAQAPLT